MRGVRFFFGKFNLNRQSTAIWVDDYLILEETGMLIAEDLQQVVEYEYQEKWDKAEELGVIFLDQEKKAQIEMLDKIASHIKQLSKEENNWVYFCIIGPQMIGHLISKQGTCFCSGIPKDIRENSLYPPFLWRLGLYLIR